MRRLWFALPVVFAIGLGLLFNRGLDLDPQAMPTALVDQPLPSLTIETLTGQQVTPSDVRGPALVNVWATWCIACVVEHPYLNHLAKNGVPIYGLNYKDNDQDARAWLVEKGNPYQLNWADRDGLLGLELGVTGAPETYLVNDQGRIVLRHQGVVDDGVWESKFAAYF